MVVEITDFEFDRKDFLVNLSIVDTDFTATSRVFLKLVKENTKISLYTFEYQNDNGDTLTGEYFIKYGSDNKLFKIYLDKDGINEVEFTFSDSISKSVYDVLSDFIFSTDNVLSLLDELFILQSFYEKERVKELYTNVANILKLLEDVKNDFSLSLTDINNLLNKNYSLMRSVYQPVSNYIDTPDFYNNIERIYEIYKIVKDLKCDIDVDSITSSLNDIKTSLSNVSFEIDYDKLSNQLKDVINIYANLTSLNGSGGAKYKDGDVVSVYGYDGEWRVVASFVTLTKENYFTIFYVVSQDGRFMVVPSAFVGVK